MSKKLTALTSATTPLAGTESLYLVQGGNSRVTTTASFYIPGGTDVPIADGGTGASTDTAARTNLGVAIGSDVQAYSANLDGWSALATSAKQDASANLDGWSAIAPSTKQDADSNLTTLSSGTTTLGATGLALLADATAADARNELDTAPYVATRTSLKALDTAKDTVAILTESKREGTFTFDSSDLSTEVTADTEEGIYIAPDSDATGASGAWVRQFDGDWNFRWWADGDGTDDAAAFSSVIALAEADKLTRVFVPPFQYGVGSEVHISKPVLFDGHSGGETTTNTNTTNAMRPSFKWLGADGGRMFTHSAQTPANMIAGTTTGEQIFGGGITGVLMDGAVGNGNFADTAIWSASTKAARYDVTARQFKGPALILDGGNGILSQRNDIWVHVIWGSTPADTGDMDGVLFRRFNGKPSTQNTIHRAHGLVYDGDLVQFEDTDNNHAKIIHGVTQSGGSGRALACLNGSTNHARNNIISYLAGDAHFESSTRGNTIIWTTSEGQTITKDAGAQYHILSLVDYTNADRFHTLGYPLSDERDFSAGEMHSLNANAVLAVSAGKWIAMEYGDSGLGAAGINFAPNQWSDGSVTGLKLNFSTDTANTSASVRLTVQLFTNSVGNAIATPTVSESFTVGVNDNANRLNSATLTLASPMAYARGNPIMLRLERDPTHGDDDAGGRFELLTGTLLYESDGPDSAGSGPYAIPPSYV